MSKNESSEMEFVTAEIWKKRFFVYFQGQ